MIFYIILGIIVALIVIAGLLLASGYKKAPPDKAFVISGLNKKNRILIGRAGLKNSFL